MKKINGYPREVYCAVSECNGIAYALCAEDDPTCEMHGDKHTCGNDVSTIMPAERVKRVDAFGKKE